MPAATDLLISEYIEGSSNNKAIEIFNGTGAAIDLSQYRLELYSNGSATVSQFITLSGTLAAGEVFVLANASANATIQAQTDVTNSAVINFNGDDALVLRKGGAGGTVIDSIGQVGVDPGTEWGTGLTSTQDNTIRLKSDVSTGDTNPFDAFDPSVRYGGFAVDTFDGLGQHTFDGGGDGDLPVVSVSATDDRATEGTDAAFSFTFARTGATTDALTVDITLGGTASAADYTDTLGQPAPTTVTFAAGSATAVLELLAVDDADIENSETVLVDLVDGLTYDLGGADQAAATIVSDEVPITLISAIQGDGAASAMQGQTVTIEAVITGDFQNGDADTARSIGGFFVQEETSDFDADAATSEGIFINEGAAATLSDLAVGTRVRITAVVAEAFGRTVLQGTSGQPLSIQMLAGDGSADIAAAEVALPLTTAGREAYESMLVTIPQEVVVSEQFNLDRFGEVRVYASEGDGLAGDIAETADGRAYQFTQVYEPTTDGSVAAYTAEIAQRTLVYDDGLDGQNQPIANPDGGGVYTTANAPQMGDTISGLTGILDYGFSDFRLRSTADGQNDFQDTNPREAAPEPVGGSLTVASLNVLNFFVTLDASGARIDNGQEPRGANTQAELDRQVDKLVETILAIDADVLGLVELENDFSTGGVNALADGNAVAYLVEQLNAGERPDVWSWVDPGQDFVGSDAISVGFIYRNDVVEIAEGTVVAIDNNAVHNRPPMAVTFEEIATGGVFTTAVNHFKSKGSGSGTGNTDAGDGQGLSNADRVAQANALVSFLAGAPTGTTDTDVILVGDFNAYFQEDPLDALRAADYETLGGATSYSYTFDGQLGSLDHILANGTVQSQVTGTTKWHINSDEADALDYNLDFGRDAAIFDAEVPYRTSDHDPILAGLDLTPTDKFLTGTADADTLRGRNGNDRLLGLAGEDQLFGSAGNDVLDGGVDNDTMAGGFGDDTYVVRDALDVVDETGAGGVDQVRAHVSHTLATGVENLLLVGGLRGEGNSEDNLIFGGPRFEELLGMGGDDKLVGGGGRDVMTGGTGFDIFSFGALADSVITTSRSDRITDFSRAEGDRISVSGIDANSLLAGDQAFSFSGAGFSGVAGQLRSYWSALNQATIVQGDVNGDSRPDFQIILESASNLNLTAADFYL